MVSESLFRAFHLISRRSSLPSPAPRSLRCRLPALGLIRQWRSLHFKMHPCHAERTSPPHRPGLLTSLPSLFPYAHSVERSSCKNSASCPTGRGWPITYRADASFPRWSLRSWSISFELDGLRVTPCVLPVQIRLIPDCYAKASPRTPAGDVADRQINSEFPLTRQAHGETTLPRATTFIERSSGARSPSPHVALSRLTEALPRARFSNHRYITLLLPLLHPPTALFPE